MSAVMESPVLAELMKRAGASDKDRSAWLAERMGGVTATEVKDLYLKGPTFKRELIEKKLGIREETFVGNQYTEWGKKREPIIAAWVASRFAIADEHRVFRAADNARFLASPDGVGVNWDDELSVSEIKTSKFDITPGSEKFDQIGYRIQMTWSMRVTGARRCLYAWEQHDDVWVDRGGQFPEPLPLQAEPLSEWIEYDQKLADELERIAVEFLAELDSERARLDAGEGVVVDEDLDTHAVNLLRFREMEADGKKAKEAEWKLLLDWLGEQGTDFSQESTLARITYSAAVLGTAEVVDQEKAVEADPKLWAAVERAEKALAKRRDEWAVHAAGFMSSVPSTKSAKLTVTSVKPAKDKKETGK